MWSERTPIFRRMLTCMQPAGPQQRHPGKGVGPSCCAAAMQQRWGHAASYRQGCSSLCNQGIMADLVVFILDDVVEVACLSCTVQKMLSSRFCKQHATR